MSSKKEHKDASEFLDNLVEVYSGFDDLSLEELKEELREEGIDPDSLLAKAQGLIDSKIRSAKHAWKEEAKQEKLEWEKRLSKKRFKVPESIEAIKKIIRDMMDGNYGAKDKCCAAASFRNLEEINDEDLRTLYEDFMQLRLLSEDEDGEIND